MGRMQAQENGQTEQEHYASDHITLSQSLLLLQLISV